MKESYEPQVEILWELKTCVDVLFNLTVDARDKLGEWQSLWKRLLRRQQTTTLNKIRNLQMHKQAILPINTHFP